MSMLQSIILGLVQGLTELLPISSSGHLIFVPHLLGWPDQGLAFDVMVHMGTLLAVVIAFRSKIWDLIKAFSSTRPELQADRKLAWLIILATIPAGVFGMLADNWIETNLRMPWLVGVNLIFWGLVLLFADSFSKALHEKHKKDLHGVTWKNALLVGFAQALALFPGTSRSGITMSAGLLSRFDKQSAIEFSFLMSIPIIGAAGLLKMFDLAENLQTVGLDILAAGFISSLLGGLFAIWLLLKIVRRYSFTPFVVYRIALGLFIVLFLNS